MPTNVPDPGPVRETIRAFISQSVNLTGLGDEDDLFESGIVNSLFAVQLTTFVEGRFGIEVGMDDLEIDNFRSIAATAAFVERKISAGDAPSSG